MNASRGTAPIKPHARARAFASPGTIRRQASRAWRAHVRAALVNVPRELRLPADGELPLSPAEIEFGVRNGLIAEVTS